MEHPSDGRILYYDIEDFDEAHAYPVVMDRGLLGNDGMLKGSKSKIVDLHGSCRHVASFEGSDDKLEFYSNNIVFRPKLKMSIFMWIKPTDIDKKQQFSTLFVITGMHPDPITSLIRIDRLENGSIRCQHRNENGSFVFDIMTDLPDARMNEWVHIGCTYNTTESSKGDARLYINGTLKYRASGNGCISKDWDGYAAIGNDNEGNIFTGYIDEVMIYDRTMTSEEISAAFAKCKFDKYYTGEMIKTDSGIIISPEYPNMYTGPIDAHWIIRGSPQDIIELTIETLKMGQSDDCLRSNLILREIISGFLIAQICGDLTESKQLSSSSPGITIDFETSGEEEGIKYKIKFKKKPKSITKREHLEEDSTCVNMAVVEDIDSIDSFKYVIDVDQTESVDDCIKTACDLYKSPHVAYFNKLCFSLSNDDQNMDYLNNSVVESSKSSIVSTNQGDYNNCEFSSPLSNVIISNKTIDTLKYMIDAFNAETCKEQCCHDQYCAGIIFFDNKCYTFNCKGNCSFRPIIGKSYNIKVYFRSKTFDGMIANKQFKKEKCAPENLPATKLRINSKNSQILQELYHFNYISSSGDLNGCLESCCYQKDQCFGVYKSGNQCFGLNCFSSDCNLIHGNVNSSYSEDLEVIVSDLYFNKIRKQNNLLNCRVERISFNQIFTYGLNSGNFINMGRVNVNDDCPKLVCNFNNDISIAYLVGNYCFAVDCYDEERCQTKMIEGNNDSAISLSTTIWFFGKSSGVTRNNIKRKSKIEIVTQDLKTCYAGNVFQGYLMDKAIEKYIKSKIHTLPTCIASCCDTNDCDLALLNGTDCFNIPCKILNDCVVKLEHNQQPLSSITYMVRSSENTLPELDYAEQCVNFSNYILPNKTFSSIPVSTLRFLGLVKNLQECAYACCKRYYCDTVYVVGYSCYGLLCGKDMKLCHTNDSFIPNIPSYIVYNLKQPQRLKRISISPNL